MLRWPTAETLTHIKLTFEVLLLVLVIPLILYTFAKDKTAAAKLALAAR